MWIGLTTECFPYKPWLPQRDEIVTYPFMKMVTILERKFMPMKYERSEDFQANASVHMDINNKY